MWQLSAALGVGLILLGGSFKLYYDKTEAEKQALRGELQQAISNQAILEGEIKAQNDEIERQLAREKENLQKINQLTDAARAAEKEVTDMRQTFAKHNLNMLSVRKPGLIERVINKGTAKVNEELAAITDPSQLN
jgi:predicted  nucleic acid-binding Zn-ribbon protein